MSDSPLTLERKALFWLAGFLLFCWLLWLLHGIMLPFVAGLALAYFFDPMVTRLEKWKVPRIIGTLLVIGIFILSFIMALVLVLPLLLEQLSALVVKLPSYAQRLQSLLTDKNKEWLSTLTNGQVPDVSKNVGEIVSKAVSWLSTILTSLISGGAAIISIFSLLVVTPVVAFYLLYDWNRMVKAVDSYIPPRARKDVRKIARDINKALSGFIRGQALVCLFLGLFYGIGLTLCGLPFGFIIGIITGFISFIPYVGSLTGLVLAMGVAIVTFYPDWFSIGLVGLVFAIGQFLEGNILSPKLVGESVGLHPVWLMFALFAFGSLFGFVGLLIAVPVAAIIGVLLRYALHKYIKSPLYKEEPL